jgi:muconate cycloisomerase
VVGLTLRRIALVKRYPLAISRGVSTGSVNLFAEVREDDQVGLGEGAPGTGTSDQGFAEDAEGQARALWEARPLGVRDPRSRPATCDFRSSMREFAAVAREMEIARPVAAALDIALWDLEAKRAGQPLARYLGAPTPSAPSSATIGINPPEVVRERVPEILSRTGARALKIKLGAGTDADQAQYEAAREAAAPFGVRLRVDANGGWDLAVARRMLSWLAERGCDYVEQPLPQGAEDELAALFTKRPLPIFADESCHLAVDVEKLADRVDGVNLKLMKTGGVTEALDLIDAARMRGLDLMIGCMGESSIAISAGAALSGWCRYVDLDSHLNLAPDPATGAELVDGVLVPPDRPGHGGALR